MLRKKWQWHLLTMLRQTVKTPEIRRLIDTCYTRYREGFVTNVQKGEVPTRYQQTSPKSPLRIWGAKPTLLAVEHFDEQLCGAMAE